MMAKNPKYERISDRNRYRTPRRKPRRWLESVLCSISVSVKVVLVRRPRSQANSRSCSCARTAAWPRSAARSSGLARIRRGIEELGPVTFPEHALPNAGAHHVPAGLPHAPIEREACPSKGVVGLGEYGIPRRRRAAPQMGREGPALDAVGLRLAAGRARCGDRNRTGYRRISLDSLGRLP